MNCCFCKRLIFYPHSKKKKKKACPSLLNRDITSYTAPDAHALFCFQGTVSTKYWINIICSAYFGFIQTHREFKKQNAWKSVRYLGVFLLPVLIWNISQFQLIILLCTHRRNSESFTAFITKIGHRSAMGFFLCVCVI